MKTKALSLTFCVMANTVLAADLPDPSMTPGAINPDITQANIQQTVCIRGWTKTVRPPRNYTNKLKKIQLWQYGYADKNPAHYEEDHLIPLSVGGAPDDTRNLWPQPRLSEWNAAKKDQLEFALYKAMCNGELSLQAARQAFQSDWISEYKRYGTLLIKYGHGNGE